MVSGGMGGFLNPPTHPEHTQHVETDLRKRPENRGGMSLSTTLECEWMDDATKAAARTALDSWQRPPMDAPEVIAWILQVLGYFKGCYRGPDPEPECWHAGRLSIDDRDPMQHLDEHAGVRLIRKYYPEFMPTAQMFLDAYWGTKPSP